MRVAGAPGRGAPHSRPVFRLRLERYLSIREACAIVNRQALSALALVPALTLPAAATGEVCVTCSGPPAIYRCTVDEASKIEGYRHGKRVMELACITELAKAGGHEQCRVRRTGSETCFGLERSVSLVGSLEALAARAETEVIEEPVDEPQPLVEKPNEPGPPKTVAELARRTADASKKQLEKTGKAVKKGWGCLTSLFQDC